MLSSATYYKQVPKGLKQNLEYRRYVLKALAEDKRLRVGMMAACRDDIVFWINTFVVQYNAFAIGDGSLEVGPFITWDFQDWALLSQDLENPGILWCIDHKEDMLILKSREMGASWLCLIVMTWLLLFHDWKNMLVISKSADAVDKPGDKNCLFWKIDFILEHLPDWMKKGVAKTKFIFNNARTRSSINGAASTGISHLGGRGQLMFVDEFPVIKEDFELLNRTASTAATRIFNGTHNGTDTAFYQLSDPSSAVGSFIKRLVMHWTQHPDKVKGKYRYDSESNSVDVLDKDYQFPPDFQFVMTGYPTGGMFPCVRSPWYDKMTGRMASTRSAAEELDIDAAGSMSQVADAFTINHLIQSFCQPAWWEGDLNFDEDTGRPFGLVEIPNGALKLWCHLINGKPKPAKYAVGADIATGNGATPSCLSVMVARGSHEVKAGEKVLGYVNPRMRPEIFAAFVVAICHLFADEEGEPALLCWEMQGPGEHFGKRVIDMGYRNMYYRQAEHDLNKRISTSPGWYPAAGARGTSLREYLAALYARHCQNRDEAAMREILNYRHKKGGEVEHARMDSPDDPSGARVNHGDRVVADFLAWKMCLALGIRLTQAKLVKEPPILSLEWRRNLRQNSKREVEWVS